MSTNIRTITVTTRDGQEYSSNSTIGRQTGLDQCHDLFRNFDSLAHIRLVVDNGNTVYLNPKHIVSACISNTEEA